MSVLDLLIIYLACGAPFGVYRLMTLGKINNREAAPLAAIYLAIWPYFTVRAAYQYLRSPKAGPQALVSSRSGQICADIESIVFAGRPVSSVFEFREVFNRYVGLCEAVNAANESVRHQLDIPLTEGCDPDVAAACAQRRNREKLLFHQTAARNDFIDAISLVALDPRERAKLIGIAVDLAQHLDDGSAVPELVALEIPSTSAPPLPGHRNDQVRAVTSART